MHIAVDERGYGSGVSSMVYTVADATHHRPIFLLCNVPRLCSLRQGLEGPMESQLPSSWHVLSMLYRAVSYSYEHGCSAWNFRNNMDNLL